MQLKDKQHPALVLSGGGIKAAAFHIGVCLALKELGFNFAGGSKEDVERLYSDNSMTFKTYVGSSAGSIIGTFLAAGHSVEAIIHAFLKGAGLDKLARKRKLTAQEFPLTPLTYKDIFALNVEAGSPTRFIPNIFKKKPVMTGGLEVLLKSGFKVNGIFSMKNMERYIREEVVKDNHFSSLGVQLYVIATQLNHPRKVIFGDYDDTKATDDIKYAHYAKISEAVAASASLPPAFRPYGITKENGEEVHFFDGEIRDTLSTHVAADHGADLVIASYSIQPYQFNDEMGSLYNYGIPMIFNQALYQTVQQKINAHIKHKSELKALINSVNGYLKEIDLPQEQRNKLMEILISRTRYKENVDYIYIHPDPQDHKMFFYDHFSLNPKVLTEIVSIGFKAAMGKLRNVSF